MTKGDVDVPQLLDRLISTSYVRVEIEKMHMRRVRSLSPMRDVVARDIHAMGLPCMDERLVSTFDEIRRDLLSAPIPEWDDPGTTSGEIPWRGHAQESNADGTSQSEVDTEAISGADRVP